LPHDIRQNHKSKAWWCLHPAVDINLPVQACKYRLCEENQRSEDIAGDRRNEQMLVVPAPSGCGVVRCKTHQAMAHNSKDRRRGQSRLFFPHFTDHLYSSQRKIDFCHEWVFFSVPLALAVSIFGSDCPNGYRSGPGGLVDLIRILPAMSKKGKEKLMAQHQSGEPFSSVSNTTAAHLQYGRRWRAPMLMLITSETSSFVCTSYIGMSFPPATNSYPRYLRILTRRYCRS